MERELMSISQVVHATGLRSSALRYYERQGLIKPDARVSGRRHYQPGVVRRVAVIRLLQDVGFTIAEISRILSHGDGRQGWKPIAEHKLIELEAKVERMQEARKLLVSALRCECSALDACELVAARQNPHQMVIHQLTTSAGTTPSP